MAQDVFLVEIVAWNPNAQATTTLRYATGLGHVTGPGETPANTIFEARVKQPSAMTRTMFAPGTTRGRSTTGLGDVVLLNGDGELDVLGDYGFDGRAITIRRGPVGAAYPSGFTTVFVGTMGVPEITQEEVIIKLRDRQAEVNVPLQTTKYLGSGLGTLEGVAGDLKGKPKPVCYGKVFNVMPPCVETAKLIYQVNDGAIASIDGVYDRGLPLGDSVIFAVGDNAQLSMSPDGLRWTTRVVSGFSVQITGIAYDAGTLVIVGLSGKIYTSADGGYTWTPRTSGVATALTGVTFGAGLFVAVGSSGVVLTSPTGETWTSRTSTFGADTVRAIVWSGSVFVIVGNNGQLASSTDATAWTNQTSGFGADNIDAVAFGNGVYVAVGGVGKISSSANGTAWTARTSNNGGGEIVTVAYGDTPALWVAAGVGGVIVQSPDGTTWAVQNNTTPLTAVDQVQGSIFANGQFILAANLNRMLLSPTGLGSWVPAQPEFAVSDGAWSFLAVTEPLPPRTYSNTTDLLNDTLAPPPGSYGVYLAGGYFRLGATPDGTVTADVTEGATAADRTVAQVYKRILDDRAGMSSSDWSASDLTTLDADDDSVIGFWTDAETTCASVFDLVAGSVWASWFVDQLGIFRIKQLLGAEAPAAIAFTANDLLKPLRRIAPNDQGQGIPSYQSIVRYAKNYTVQDVDVVSSATQARRETLSKEWLEAQSTDSAVQTAHALAIQTIEDSLLTVEADAQAEATRRQALRGAERFLFELVVPFNDDTQEIDLADVIQVSHDRFGLYVEGDDDGTYDPLFTVLGLATNAAERTLTMTVWGPTHQGVNRVTQDGAYRVTSDGAYRIRLAA